MMATSPMESLSSGFIINIELFFITLLLALPLGLVITFCSMSKFKPLKWLSRTFVWIIRGTPLMLQLFVVLYAPGLLFSMPMSSRFTAAIIAFVINYAAYFSEIYRGGIESRSASIQRTMSASRAISTGRRRKKSSSSSSVYSVFTSRRASVIRSP